MLPCTSQRLIFCGGDNHSGELQSSRHPLQRPNPAGLRRRRSLGRRAPPPRLPSRARAARARAEARARHPRPGWDPGLLWRSPFGGSASEQRREETPVPGPPGPPLPGGSPSPARSCSLLGLEAPSRLARNKSLPPEDVIHLIYQTERVADVESKLMVGRGKRRRAKLRDWD